MFASISPKTFALAILCLAAIVPLSAAQAQQATELQIGYDRQLQPNELRAPAGKSFTVKVKNNSAKAMEFESKTLMVEKIIPSNGEGAVNLRARKAEHYEFFDEINEKARGAVVVE